MRTFNILLTGDYLGENGQVASGDIGLGVLDNVPHVRAGFLLDQKPGPRTTRHIGTVCIRLEIKPHHIAEANGLVVLRPWVKASAFSAGADNLLVIGRARGGLRQD